MTACLTMRRLAVVVTVGALLAGCSSGGDETATRTSTKTKTAIPKECQSASGGDPTSTTILSEACQNAIYAQALEGSQSKDVAALSNERKVAFGRGLCEYAKALAASTDPRPSFAELEASTAKSWGVTPQIFEEIYEASRFLCPTEIDTITDLKKPSGPIAVEFDVGGSGSVDVTYTLPDGNPSQKSVTAPWQQIVNLPQPIDVSVTAAGSKGANDVSCSIKVGDKQIVERAAGAKSSSVECTASGADIGRAAGSG